MRFGHETVDLSPVQAAVFASGLIILISAVLALTLELYRILEDRAVVPQSKIESPIHSDSSSPLGWAGPFQVVTEEISERAVRRSLL